MNHDDVAPPPQSGPQNDPCFAPKSLRASEHPLPRAWSFLKVAALEAAAPPLDAVLAAASARAAAPLFPPRLPARAFLLAAAFSAGLIAVIVLLATTTDAALSRGLSVALAVSVAAQVLLSVLRGCRRAPARAARRAGAGAAVEGDAEVDVEVVSADGASTLMRVPMERLRLLTHAGAFTADDYAALSALDAENVPTAALAAATEVEIDRLPCHAYVPPTNADGGGGGVGGGSSSGGSSQAADACAICLERYAPRECIRLLPCLHAFHADCIDPWLAVKASCAVCRVSIREYHDAFASSPS